MNKSRLKSSPEKIGNRVKGSAEPRAYNAQIRNDRSSLNNRARNSRRRLSTSFRLDRASNKLPPADVTFRDKVLHAHSDVSTSHVSVSIGPCLRSTMKRVHRVCPSSRADVLQILESFILVFLARRTASNGRLFVDSDYERFVASCSSTLVTLNMVFGSDDSVGIDRVIAFCKYWLDLALYKAIENQTDEPPILPFDSSKLSDQYLFGPYGILPLFTGFLRRQVSRAENNRDLSFLYSLQKGSKQAWPKLSDKKLEAAYHTHKDRLSSHRPPVPEDVRETVVSISQRIFHSSDCSKFLPSSSACVQSSVMNGGCLSLFPPLVLESDLTLQLGLHRASVLVSEVWRKENFEKAFLNATSIDLEEHLPLDQGVVFPWTTNQLPALAINRISPVALFEPGKIRMISKGDGYLYSALQPIQGAMISSWKRTPWSTMDLLKDGDLSNSFANQIRNRFCNDLFEDFSSLIGEEFLFVSGDFEAATDLLKKDASFAAMEGLRSHPLFFLLSRSFLPGYAHYPDHISSIPVYFSEGQLMGHPCSFPLLCGINVACFAHALGLWFLILRPYLYKKAAFIRSRYELSVGAFIHNIKRSFLDSILVNGDDILFRMPLSFYNLWRETISSVGFKLSAGKNYISRDICMINSLLFKIRGRDVRRLGYLNQTIVRGLSVKKGDDACKPTQIANSLSDMISFCPWAASCIPLTFQRWSLKGYSPFTLNWFIPVGLGGFGLSPRFSPRKVHYSLDQRRLAKFFKDNAYASIYRSSINKVSLNLLKSLSASVKFVRNDDIRLQDPSYFIDQSDPWLDRLTMITRMMSPRENINEVDPMRLRVIKGTKFSGTLSPAEIEEFPFLHTIRLPSSVVPPLHQLSPLIAKYSSLYFERPYFGTISALNSVGASGCDGVTLFPLAHLSGMGSQAVIAQNL